MLTTLLSLVIINNLAFLEPVSPWPANHIILDTSPFPIKKTTTIAPVLQAKAYLSQDLETGQTLFVHNGDERLPMASLTKLMLAKIILAENKMDEVVKVTKEATLEEPSKINLVNGEKITVRELLKAVMIKSANDAAIALAIHNAGNVDDFVKKMNLKAQEMGLTNTHFQNPAGFDSPDHYSSVNDLAVLTRMLYKNKFIQETAPLLTMQVSSVDGAITHAMENTNGLLKSYLKVLGLKTGTTDLAAQCLISIVENENGNKILNVMLGSNDRYKETKILSQWIFDSFNWI